jgi:hypothetical protein
MKAVPSSRNVLFVDHVSEAGYGIEIQFRDHLTTVHTLFMGDTNYNSAIVMWILFGKDPNEEIEP